MNNKTAAEQVVNGDLTIGNFTLQAQMPTGKSITMSGYIFAHSDVESINKQIDMMHDVLDRQRTRAEIPELEVKLEQRRTQLIQMGDHMRGLEDKTKKGAKLSSVEKKQLDDLVIAMKHVKDDIEKGERAVTEAKNKVKGS